MAFVTLVLLPALRSEQATARMEMFERLERRFARQAKLSVVVAGLSGFFMTHELVVWSGAGGGVSIAPVVPQPTITFRQCL